MKDQIEEQDFPGYPHYPSGEDITKNNNGKAEVEQDGSINTSATQSADADDDELEIVMGTEADVTAEDLRLLNDDSPTAELDNTDLDGEPLNEVYDTTLQPGNDLDVPGSEADDANEQIGEEDEENNYYSLGGDKEESAGAE
jgi:hypothetical protein